MNIENLRLDKSSLTAEIFYTAFLGLPYDEKEKFISRLFSSLNKKAVAFTIEGKILSKKQYVDYIENVSSEVKEGNYIDHNEIEKYCKDKHIPTE